MAATAPKSRRSTNGKSKAKRQRRAVAAVGPRADRRAERRQAILTAALREFSARGFAAGQGETFSRPVGSAGEAMR